MKQMYTGSWALCLFNDLPVNNFKDFVVYHDKTKQIGHVA